jgi:L-tartrate/succinate antiporter
MWVAIAATSVTSSMFLTGLAPNLLALELVKKAAKVELAWADWFVAGAPAGILLLIFVPLLAYWIYPPQVKEGNEVPQWAAQEITKLGSISSREITLAVLVVIALLLWIFGGDHVNATTVALIVISLMLLTKVVTWDDITKNSSAWNTLAWFATLVAADGSRGWVSSNGLPAVASHMSGFTPVSAIVLLLVIHFFSHYMFASITAHVTAMLPVLLAVGSTIPDMNMAHLAQLLCLQLGIMGIITPYGTGPSPVYYGSGYLPSADYWRLGAIFGIIFFVVFTAISLPWVLARGE